MHANEYIDKRGPLVYCYIIGEEEANANLGVQGDTILMPARLTFADIRHWYDSMDGADIGFPEGVVVVVLACGNKMVVRCPLHIFDQFMHDNYADNRRT